jgi:hypothetical protein
MLSTLRIPALAVSLASAACAHTPAPAPWTGSSTTARPPASPPLSVSYRVLRSLDGEGVLLSGRMDVSVHDDGRIQAIASHNSAEEQLEVTVRPEDDGTLVARVRYEERGPDGTSIKWQPSMRVARGTPVRAEVTGAGWARAIELTVQ